VDINLHETDSSLGSPKPEVSLYDDFEPCYQSRSNLQDFEPLPSVEQVSSLCTSLSHDIAPHNSSLKDVTKDVLVYADSPAPFNYSCEFEVGEDLGNPNELDLSLDLSFMTYNEHHDKDKSEAMSL